MDIVDGIFAVGGYLVIEDRACTVVASSENEQGIGKGKERGYSFVTLTVYEVIAFSEIGIVVVFG